MGLHYSIYVEVKRNDDSLKRLCYSAIRRYHSDPELSKILFKDMRKEELPIEIQEEITDALGETEWITPPDHILSEPRKVC